MSPCGLESGEEAGYGPIFTAVTNNFSWDRYIDVSERIIKIKIWFLKNEQRIWINGFPNKTYKWPTGIWEAVHWSPGKRKLKPHTCQNGYYQKDKR